MGTPAGSSDGTQRRPGGGAADLAAAGAAGALLYRFAAPGEVDTAAVQCEAVNEGGERMAFSGGVGKRPSVTGSDFDDGRRVFVARSGGAEGGGVNPTRSSAQPRHPRR